MLTPGLAYEPVGGEMTNNSSGTIIVTPSFNSIWETVNHHWVGLRAYNIRDNNFFMLRDLGDALGFNIDWDAETNTILITTD